jgi:GTP-binding protein HflX
MMVALDAMIPYQRNDLVALWHERGVVESQEFKAEGTYIQGRVPGTLVRQFAGFATTSVG